MNEMNQTIYQLKVMFIVGSTYYGVPILHFPARSTKR